MSILAPASRSSPSRSSAPRALWQQRQPPPAATAAAAAAAVAADRLLATADLAQFVCGPAVWASPSASRRPPAGRRRRRRRRRSPSTSRAKRGAQCRADRAGGALRLGGAEAERSSRRPPRRRRSSCATPGSGFWGDASARLQAAMDQVMPPPARFQVVWSRRPRQPAHDLVGRAADQRVRRARYDRDRDPVNTAAMLDVIRCVPKGRRGAAAHLVYEGAEGSVGAATASSRDWGSYAPQCAAHPRGDGLANERWSVVRTDCSRLSPEWGKRYQYQPLAQRVSGSHRQLTCLGTLAPMHSDGSRGASGA